MGTEFTPLFLFILVAIMVAIGMLATTFLGPRKTTSIKQMPYESGMDPIGDARQRFDVRYYLVAIAFLLFDVELLFLYPFAAVAQWSGRRGCGIGASVDPAAVAGPATRRPTPSVRDRGTGWSASRRSSGPWSSSRS